DPAARQYFRTRGFSRWRMRRGRGKAGKPMRVPTASALKAGTAFACMLLCACASNPRAAEEAPASAEDEIDSLPDTPPAPEEAIETQPVEPKRAFRHPCKIDRDDDEPWVDETQAMLEETGCRAALWLDGLFGDDSQV